MVSILYDCRLSVSGMHNYVILPFASYCLSTVVFCDIAAAVAHSPFYRKNDALCNTVQQLCQCVSHMHVLSRQMWSTNCFEKKRTWKFTSKNWKDNKKKLKANLPRLCICL